MHALSPPLLSSLYIISLLKVICLLKINSEERYQCVTHQTTITMIIREMAVTTTIALHNFFLRQKVLFIMSFNKRGKREREEEERERERKWLKCDNCFYIISSYHITITYGLIVELALINYWYHPKWYHTCV